MAQVDEVVESVVVALKTVQDLNGLAFHVYSEKELLDKTKFIAPPAAGVVYEGMRASADSRDSHRTGLAADLSIALVVFLKPEIANETTVKTAGVTLLDQIRNVMRDTKSPTGHYWRFLVEAPALEKDGMVMWVQRWTTPIKLTQGL